MKKLISILFLIISINCPINAEDCRENSIQLSTGYRQDKLDWSIAGYHGHPTVLSELEWKNLNIIETYLKGTLTIFNNYYLKAQGNYGKIVGGRVIDSDYLEDHRKDLFSLSHSDAGKGEVYDLSIGIGKQYEVVLHYLWVAPMIGYSYNVQNLAMYNGQQKVNTFSPDFVGRIDGLHSSYKAQWSGPWIGADLKIFLCKKLQIIGTVEYHLNTYYAKGHWNLRTDFLDDFKHKAYGQGFSGTLGFEYFLRKNLSLALTGNYLQWTTGKGRDKTVLEVERYNNGILETFPLPIKTRINSINWRSFGTMIAICYKF